MTTLSAHWRLPGIEATIQERTSPEPEPLGGGAVDSHFFGNEGRGCCDYVGPALPVASEPHAGKQNFVKLSCNFVVEINPIENS